nr:urease accessory protein UreE [Quisquiliibacterium transsilvanicum]
MLTVCRVLAGGGGLAPALVRRAPALMLPWDVRQRSRFDAVDSAGRRLGVFLPRGSVLRGGDVLVAEDGSLARVVAADEPVMVVRARASGSRFDLVRAAYHLGNRHVRLELAPECLKLDPDHVLAAMLRTMGLEVEETVGAFEPEGGAYSGHGHGHVQGDDVPHGHAHGHGPAALHAHGHGDDAAAPRGHGDDASRAGAPAR